MKKYLSTVFSICILLFACSKNEEQKPEVKQVMVSPDDSHFAYVGRVNLNTPSSPIIYWAGSGFVVNFSGTSIGIVLDDKSGNNYFNAIVDNNTDNIIVIDCDKGEKKYVIATGLNNGEHKLELYKRTDPTSSSTDFKGLYIDEGSELKQKPSLPDYKIEFYGNSITSGNGIHDVSRQDNENRVYWDNYHTYASVVSRELNAEARCISVSGIGLLAGWISETMEEVYDNLNPWDENSSWNFSSWQADMVVVNILQNDSWKITSLSPVPTDAEIVEAYVQFIRNIRAKYPNAKIVCTLGSMSAASSSSKWRGFVEDAVQTLNAQYNDNEVYSHIMPFFSTQGHPSVSEHQQMATDLLQFINSVK